MGQGEVAPAPEALQPTWWPCRHICSESSVSNWMPGSPGHEEEAEEQVVEEAVAMMVGSSFGQMEEAEEERRRSREWRRRW